MRRLQVLALLAAWIHHAASSVLEFLAVDPYLACTEDTAISLASLQLGSTVAATTPIHVLITAQHGSIGVASQDGPWSQSRVLCDWNTPTLTTAPSNRTYALLFEATLSSANGILRSLDYLPDANYNFDWAAGATAAWPLCIHPQQSLESIHISAIESTLLSTQPACSAFQTRGTSHPLDPGAVTLDWPVSITAVNDPPTITGVPSSMQLLPINDATSCATLPPSITLADVDNDEVPGGGQLTVVLDIRSLSPTTSSAVAMTIDRTRALGRAIAAVDLAVGGASNSTHVVTSKAQLRGSVASLNEFLSQVLVCGFVNATVNVMISDNGGCGQPGPATVNASFEMIARPTTVPMMRSEASSRPFETRPSPLVVPDATIATPFLTPWLPSSPFSIQTTPAGSVGFPTPPRPSTLSVQTMAYEQTLTLARSEALQVRQIFQVGVSFAKEVQRIAVVAAAPTAVDEAVVQLSFTALGTTSTAVVDLTRDTSPSDLAAALTALWTNAGRVRVSRLPPTDTLGSVAWAITFDTLAGSALPLVQATAVQVSAGATIAVTREAKGSQAPPTTLVQLTGAAGGSYVLDIRVDGDCVSARTSDVFSTAQLLVQATPAQIQAAVQQHADIDVVVVTAVTASSYELAFVSNVYTATKCGVVVAPRFFQGTGTQACGDCVPGVTRIDVTTTQVGSQEIHPTDTWRFVRQVSSTTTDAGVVRSSAWLPIVASPQTLQDALTTLFADENADKDVPSRPDAVVQVTTRDCGAPTMLCTWVVEYTGPIATVQVSLESMQRGIAIFQNDIVQASPVAWSPSAKVRFGDHFTISAAAMTLSDRTLTGLLTAWCQCTTVSATTTISSAGEHSWVVRTATPKQLTATSLTNGIRVTVTPVLSVYAPAPVHHVALLVRPAPTNARSIIPQATILCNAVGGTFTLGFQTDETPPLPFDTSVGQLRVALPASLSTLSAAYVTTPSGDVSTKVCSNPPQPVTVWFGVPGVQEWTVQSSVQPAIHALTWTAAAPSLAIGVQFQFQGVVARTTLTLAADRTDTTAAAVKRQLESMATVGVAVDVSAQPRANIGGVLSPANEYTWWITFKSLHGPVTSRLEVLDPTITSVTTREIQPSTRRNSQVTLTVRYDVLPVFGTFRMNVTGSSVSGDLTRQVPFGAAASDVQAALDGLKPTVGLVRVVASSKSPQSSQYTLVFLTNADPGLHVSVVWNDHPNPVLSSCPDCVAPSSPYTNTDLPFYAVSTDYVADRPFATTSFQVVNSSMSPPPVLLELAVTTTATALQSALRTLDPTVLVTQTAATPQRTTWTVTLPSLNAAFPSWSVVATSPSTVLVRTMLAPARGYNGRPPRLTIQPALLRFPTTSAMVATVTASPSSSLSPLDDPVSNHIVQVCTNVASVATQQRLTVQTANTALLSGFFTLTSASTGRSLLLPVTATQAQTALLVSTSLQLNVLSLVKTTAATSIQYDLVLDPTAGNVPPLLLSFEYAQGSAITESSVVVVTPGNAVGGIVALVFNGTPQQPVPVDSPAANLKVALAPVVQDLSVQRMAANTACWRLTFAAPVDVDVVRLSSRAVAGLTGIGADVSIQVVQAMPAFRLRQRHVSKGSDGPGAMSTPPLAVGSTTATHLQQVLQKTFANLEHLVVGTHASATSHLKGWYLSNVSSLDLIELVQDSDADPWMSLVQFYTGNVTVASPTTPMYYQSVDLSDRFTVDSLIVQGGHDHQRLVQDVFVSAATAGHLVLQSKTPIGPNNAVEPTRLSRWVEVLAHANTTLNATMSLPPPSSWRIGRAHMNVTGATINGNASTSINWTALPVGHLNLAFHRTMVYPDPASATVWRRGQVTQVTVNRVSAAATRSVVLSIVPAGTGPVTGQFQLSVRLKEVSCVTQPIVYPVTGAAMDAAFAEAQARCGTGTSPLVQVVTMTFPIPVALVRPTDGTMVWAVQASQRTAVLPIQATATAVQAALRQATGENTILVTKSNVDAYTVQYQVQAVPGTTLVSIPVIQWLSSAETVVATIARSAYQVKWALTTASTCTSLACSVEFIQDVPEVAVASNQLVDNSPTVFGGNGLPVRPAILLGPPQPAPFQLFVNETLVNTTDDGHWDASSLQDSLDGVVDLSVDTVETAIPPTTVWRITYSSASRLSFRVEPTGVYTVGVETIARGEEVNMATLALAVDNLPIWSVRWSLGRVSVVSNKPTDTSVLSSNAVLPRLNHTGLGGSLKNGSSLAALPGQAIQLPLELVDIGNGTKTAKTWKIVNMTLEAKYGWLWWDVSTRNHVQYVVGTRDGGRVLSVHSTFDSLAQALVGLHYTPPVAFYGRDALTFVVASRDDLASGFIIQLNVDVPLTLLPPKIVSPSLTLLATEDTALMLTGFEANYSSTTPANCSTTLVVKLTAQSGQLVSTQSRDNSTLGDIGSLELHSNDVHTPVSMSDVRYQPKANFAGVDTVTIHAVQTVVCLAETVTAEASVDVSVLVEPVPDALELHWPAAASIFTMPSSSSTALLPPVTLTAVDAEFALFSQPFAVQLDATAQQGSVSFSSAKSTNTVVCSVEDAIAYLGDLVYAIPNDAGAATFGLPNGLLDHIVVSARKFGSSEPPVTVELNVSIPLGQSTLTCAAFSDVMVDVDEDAMVDLAPFLVPRLSNYTVVASVKNGWLSLSADAPRAKQVTLPGTLDQLHLLYQPDADFSGQDALYLSCRQGQAVIASSTLPLTVHPVNDPPAWIVQTDSVFVRNASTSVCNWWSLRDVDGTATSLYRVVISIRDEIGRITLPAFIPGVYVESNNDTNLVLQGSLAHLNNLFASCGLTFAKTVPNVSKNGTITLCVDDVDGGADTDTIDEPQCASLDVALVASTLSSPAGLEDIVPTLKYTTAWVGVEDVPGPLVGLTFAMDVVSAPSDATKLSLSVHFAATKGRVDVVSLDPCLLHLGAGWIAGDIPCLQAVFASQDVWFRPLVNANGHDEIVITYGLDHELRLPVYLEPVVDVPVWDVTDWPTEWLVRHNDSSSALVAEGRRSLRLDQGDEDDLFRLTVRTTTGHVGFAFIPGLSYPVIQENEVQVVGRPSRLNDLVASLQYIPVRRGVNDTMSLTVANATTVTILVVVEAMPLSLAVRSLNDVWDVDVMETQSMALHPMVELTGNATSDRRNVTVTCRLGSLSSLDLSGSQLLEWRDTTDQLRQRLASLVYSAPHTTGQSDGYDDEVVVQLWDINLTAVAAHVRIPVRVTPFHSPISLVCPNESKTVLENTPTSMDDWFAIPATSNANDVARVHVKCAKSSRLRLAFTPQLVLSSLAWTNDVWFQGPPAVVADALARSLSIQASDNDTVTVTITSGKSNATCAVHVVVPDTNHPPTIHVSSQPKWNVSVFDPDTGKRAVSESAVLISIKSTTASFQLTTAWPPVVLHKVPSALSKAADVFAELTFQVPWNDANDVLAGLRCIDGYGGLDLFVDDLGHGVPAYDAKNVTQFVLCQFDHVASQLSVVDAVPTKSNGVSDWWCIAEQPCVLPELAITSSSVTQVEQVTTSALMSFVPEVQTIRTGVDASAAPWNMIVDIVVGSPPLSAATQFTLQVSWQQRRDDGVPTTTYSASVTCSAAAVGTRFEEVTGAGPGRGLDESIQAKLESVLPMSVQVWRGPTTTWKVELLRDNQDNGGVLWVADVRFVSATNGLAVSVFTSQPQDVVFGSFSLAFAGASTPPLPSAVSALDLQAALELLPTIQFVSVSRTTTPDVVGGYTWTVTFLQSANGDATTTTLPLLQANATTLRPTPTTLSGVGVNRSVGNQATVTIHRVQRGYGRPPALYHLNLTSTHMDLVFDVAVVASSPVAAMAFTLVWWQAKTSDWIQFNAVGMASQEGIDQSLGGRASESLQAKLTPLLPPAATLSITRTGPSANNAYAWRVTVSGAPASLPLPSVGSSTCGSVCSVQITSVQPANSVGGSFLLRMESDATAPLAVSSPSLAGEVDSALASLPTFVKLKLQALVRTSRRDLQGGVDLVVAFVQIDATSTPLLRVDASALTGVGAMGSLATVDNFGTPDAVHWVAHDEARSTLVYQKYTGLNLIVEGTALDVNAVLASLSLESTHWYGSVDVTFTLHNTVDSRNAVAVVPVAVFQSPTPTLSIVLDAFNAVVEDATNVRVPLRLDGHDKLSPHTMVRVSLAATQGSLRRTNETSQTIKLEEAAGLLPSLLGRIYYTPPPNFHGTEQVVAVVNNQSTSVLRWQVIPVNDAPIVHIEGSVEGPFTSTNFPVFELSSPQDVLVSLPRMYIEDVDDGVGANSPLPQLAGATTATTTVLVITAVSGKLTVTTLNGMRVVQDTDTRVHVVGTVARLNAALRAVTWMPPKGFTGDASMTVWVQDSVGGVALEHVRHVTLHITAVFSLPRLNVGRAVYDAIEDLSLALTDISVADAVSNETASPRGQLVRRLYKSLVLQPDTDIGLLPTKNDDDWRLKLVDPNAGTPRWFCSFQNRLYFAADSLQYGRELFVSDVGNVTTLFADVNPGFASSSPRYLTSFQGKLYFQASGLDLAYTLVDRLSSGSSSCAGGRRTSSVSPDILFVVAESNVWQPTKTYDCPTGYSWMTTDQAKAAFTDTGSAPSSSSFVFWNQCGWSQYTYQGVSRKWFRFADSATTGAFKHAGRIDGYPIEYGMVTSEFAGVVCVRAVDVSSALLPPVLWQSDGVVATKVDVVGGSGATLQPYTSPQFLTVLTTAPWLVFQATTTAFGAELYRTNGLSTFVDDLNLGPRSSSPSNFTEFQNRLVFAATSDTAGRELWVSASAIQVNGLGWSYTVVADIFPGSSSSNPQDIVVCNGVLFFTADNGASGREVWKWDGVAAPAIVQDLWPGAMGSSPASLTCYNNKVYFAAIASASLGVELYSTSGVTISLVQDIVVGAGSSSPSFLTVQSVVQSSLVRTLLVFCVLDSRSTVKPTQTCTWYRSDGTSAGTLPLWDATTSFEIDADSFQVSTASQGTMVFPVVVPTATPAWTATGTSGVDLTLDIAVSKGTVSIGPFTNTPSSVRLAVMSPQQLTLTGSAQGLTMAMSGLEFLAPLNFHSDAAAASAALTAFPPSSVTAATPLISIELNLTARGLSSSTYASIYVAARDDPPVWLVPRSSFDPILRTPDNLSPRIASIAPFAVDQDVPWTFPPLLLRAVDCMNNPAVDGSYTDDDAGLQCILDVELRVRHGELSGWGPGEPAPTVRLSGTVPVLNQLLRQVTYRPSPQYIGSDDLTLTATLVVTSTVVLPILVNAVNNVPYVSVRTTYFEIDEDRVLVLDGLVAVDTDDGEVLRVQLDAAHGTVALKFTSGVSVTSPLSQGSRVQFGGGLQQVNRALANITYVSALHWNSDIGDDYDHVTVTITDSKGASTSTTVDIRVWPTPDNMVITVPSAAADTAAGPPLNPSSADTIVVNEDTLLRVANLVVSCVDNVPSSVVAVTLFVSHGELAVDTTPGVLVEALDVYSSSSEMTLTGSYARVNQALATLTYQGNLDYVGSDVLRVSIHSVITDGDGDVPSIPGARLVPLEVVAVNDPPVWTYSGRELAGSSAAGSPTVATTLGLALSKWQEGLHIDGLTFRDVDAGTSDLLEVTVDVKVGSVTLSGLSVIPNVALVGGTGVRDSYAVLRGTQAGLNAALRSLVFFLDYDAYHATPYTDSVTRRPQVVLTVDDLGNSGVVGGPNIVSTTVYVVVESMENLPPVVVAASALPLQALEDTKQSLKGVIRISDPDIDRTFGALMELTVRVDHGQVVVTSDLGIQKVVVNATSLDDMTLVLRGAVEHLQYALDMSYYLGAADWFGQDSITLTANDLGATGVGGPQQTTLVVPVKVASVCDAPSWRVASPTFKLALAATHYLQVYEDQPLYVSLHDVLLAVDDPELDHMGQTRLISLTLQATFGGLMLPSTKELRVVSSPSPPAVHPSLPSYFYSSVTIQGSVVALNLALQALVYKPAVDWSSHDTKTDAGVQYDVVKLRVQGQYCDVDTALDDVMTVFVDVLAVNDPPTLVFPDNAWETAEGTPLPLGNLSVNDVDSNTLQITVSCSNGWVSVAGPGTLWQQAGNASLDSTVVVQGTVLALQATTVVFTPAPSYSGTAFVQVNASDFLAPTVSTTLQIRVVPVLTPMQILVPTATLQLGPSKSLRLPNVALPSVLLPAAPIYVPPAASSLFKSELTQPDTKFGFWGVDEGWRSTRVSSDTASSPTFFKAFQGRMLFQATDATAGSELFQSDGQVTTRLSDLVPGRGSASPTHPMVFSKDSKLYFAADGLDVSWRPPRHLQDACQGIRFSTFHGGTRVAFVVGQSTTWQPNAAYDCPAGYSWASTAVGMDLFRTAQGRDDMTSLNVEPFTYLDQCGWQGYTWGSQARECFRFSDSKTTGACKHAGKRESFRVELANFSPQAFAGIVCVEQPASPGVVPTAYGRELWSYDGATFSRVGDLNPGPAGSNPAFMTEFQNTIVFQATDHNRGVELWVYDSVSGATSLAVDIEAGNRSSFPKFFTVFQANVVYFTAETAVYGAELWKFDGTVATLVADLCVGTCSSAPSSLAALPSWLVFQANDGTRGAELWRTNGVTTSLVMDICPGSRGSNPTGMTVYNGMVYFSATDGTNGRELWVTDGTVATMLADLQPGFHGSTPSYFTVVSPGVRSSVAVPPMLVFAAKKDSVMSLWSVDSVSGALPTRPPTLLVANVHVDVAAMDQMPQPAGFGVAGNTMFYPATANDQNGMWSSAVQSSWMTTQSPWTSKRQSIFIQDVDNLGTDIQVEVNCTQGLVVLAQTTPLNVQFIRNSRSGVPSASVVVQGPVVAVNAALRDVVYTAATNATGSDVIRVTVWRVGPGEVWLRPTSNTIAVDFVDDD